MTGRCVIEYGQRFPKSMGLDMSLVVNKLMFCGICKVGLMVNFLSFRYYSLQAIRPVHTTIGCGKQGFPSAQPYLSQYYERGQNIPEPTGACRFMGDGC